MDLERNETRSGRSAPLAQVALAALVAGSLLAFSALAFRTAFNEGAAPGSLSATTPRVTSSAPVLLPASQTASGSSSSTPDRVAAIGTDPRSDVVLGTRVTRTKDAARAAQVSDERRASVSSPRSVQPQDSHKIRHGKGHEKSHGKGHNKPKDSKSPDKIEAREEEDELDDHGDDDEGRDDDSNTSGTDGSGSRGSGGSGSGDSGDDHSGSSRG